MVASCFAALWLGLIAPASGPEARRVGGEVVVAALEVFDEPDGSSYASAELKRGDRVAIVEGGKPGWLAIAPPSGSFHWVDSASIRDHQDGSGEIIADRATVRSGAAGAKLPGPPRSTLPKGATVRLIDQPSLTVGEGPKARTWRAIATVDGEVRYVEASGVKLDGSKDFDTQVRPAQVDPGGGDAQTAIRKFQDALDRSRRIDQDVAQIKQKLADARIQTERNYDAKGLLQASSRKVDGQKVHALIGPKGVPIAYLAIPPGIPASRLLARKVGVRGDVHFNESLGTRLITVKDLDRSTSRGGVRKPSLTGLPPTPNDRRNQFRPPERSAVGKPAQHPSRPEFRGSGSQRLAKTTRGNSPCSLIDPGVRSGWRASYHRSRRGSPGRDRDRGASRTGRSCAEWSGNWPSRDKR